MNKTLVFQIQSLIKKKKTSKDDGYQPQRLNKAILVTCLFLAVEAESVEIRP